MDGGRGRGRDGARGRSPSRAPVRQTSSMEPTPSWGRRDRSMPSSSAARKTSSSPSCTSWAVPSAERTSTFRHSDCISFSSTRNDRSEEHTSELQSRGHLVCRLLLEKKKHHNL